MGRPPLGVVWDRRFLEYNFGPGHPFDERSRGLAVELFETSLAAGERAALTFERTVEVAERAVLERFHRPEYLDAVAAASRARGPVLLDRGDTPSFPGCYDATARIVGGTVNAVERALSERRDALVPAGGLHHAGPAQASGFCILNDVAVAIAGAVAKGTRVAYVDIDAHHGDGVMYGFYGSGRVLDIDFHQDGRTLFPGTGSADEIGTGDGAGLKVNLPLPPGAGDEALVPLARRLLPPLVHDFAPQLILLQHGVDGHVGDPLARLRYTAPGYAEVDRVVVELARDLNCPLVVTGGGGYRASSVSRVLARGGRILAGLPLPPDEAGVPESWRESFERQLGETAPSRWVDPSPTPPPSGGDPRTERLVRQLETHLGRRFPPAGPGPTPADVRR